MSGLVPTKVQNPDIFSLWLKKKLENGEIYIMQEAEKYIFYHLYMWNDFNQRSVIKIVVNCCSSVYETHSIILYTLILWGLLFCDAECTPATKLLQLNINIHIVLKTHRSVIWTEVNRCSLKLLQCNKHVTPTLWCSLELGGFILWTVRKKIDIWQALFCL